MRSVPIPPEMDTESFDNDFEDLLQKCKVPESVGQVLLERHFTSIAIFAFAFINEEALEEFIQHVGVLHDDPPNWEHQQRLHRLGISIIAVAKHLRVVR